MPDDLIQPHARYRTMAEGTKADYERVFEYFKAFERTLADRVLDTLRGLEKSYPGELVNRLTHSLQTATRAHRDGRDEEFVVAALLHDVGDLLGTMNHSEYAASIIKPYVRPYTYWMIRQHGLFQGYFYFHHFGLDRDAREKFRGHPAFELCLDFCDKYDQASFDPDYDSMTLAAFEPMVRRLFAREPWGAHAKEDGGYSERMLDRLETVIAEPAQRAKITALEEQGVRYGLASYVDLHGRPKCKAVPIAHFDQMLRGSELFTGAALDGVPQEVNDDEVAAHPDFERALILPWKPDTMWFPSDLWLNDQPFEACSRQILKRVLAKAAALGFTFNLGIETEFFLFRPTENGGFEPALKPDFLEKPAYDVRLLLNSAPVVEELVAAMNQLGWDVYSFDQEDALGQFETDFAYAEALTMADRFTFFRLMAGQIAAKHGLFASFMPKPFANRTGSGAHYNMSLADIATGANLFVAEDDPRGCKLSPLGYQFIAGVLRHAKAISAVIAPTVNSYKRLVAQGSMSGFTWAPIFMCYGNNNRTNMLRIPMAGGRVECRAADIACNLYLGAAMILAAGLEGIVEKRDPGEPNTENMYHVAPEELRRRGIDRLPQTLAEAISAFEADPVSRAVFGDKMFGAFVAYKKEEWRRYHTHISDWELKEYLRFF